MLPVKYLEFILDKNVTMITEGEREREIVMKCVKNLNERIENEERKDMELNDEV